MTYDFNWQVTGDTTFVLLIFHSDQKVWEELFKDLQLNERTLKDAVQFVKVKE